MYQTYATCNISGLFSNHVFAEKLHLYPKFILWLGWYGNSSTVQTLVSLPYRTPRRLVALSSALVQGRAPVSAPNTPGGGGVTTYPLPGSCVSTSVRPNTGSPTSAHQKWRLQSGRSLSSPGSLPPPEVLWQ